jgi:hypothetical protein
MRWKYSLTYTSNTNAMKHILLLACIALGMSACDYDVDKIKDTIKFSKNEVHFSAQGGVDTVTSEGTSWEIDYEMSIDGKYYHFRSDPPDAHTYPPCCFKTEDGEDVRITKFYYQDISRIEGPWFTINKPRKQRLIFTVAPNETGNPRELCLTVIDKVFSTNITVTQAAE